MEKDDKKSKIFSSKDWIIILISVIALIILGYLLMTANHEKKENEIQLELLSEKMKEDVIRTDFDSLVINEINQQGWIELYNASEKTMDLQGCYIEINGSKGYVFEEEIQLNKEQRLIVETNTSLGNSVTNVIGIYQSNGEPIVHEMFSKLFAGQSYGCLSDGSYEKGLITPTKNEKNETNLVLNYNKIHYSISGGFYDSAISVEMVGGENMVIHYTTDGTRPTIDSDIYKEPISISNRSGANHQYADMADTSFSPNSISMGTVVWAVAFDQHGNEVDERVETYYIGLSTSGDFYKMPVLSVVTEPQNLFDYFEGIYVGGRSYEDALISQQNLGGNYRENWKKTAYAEFFESDKSRTFMGTVEMSMISDFSITSPQKGFRLSENYAVLGSSLSEYMNRENRKVSVLTNKEDNNYKTRNYLAMNLLKNTNVGVAYVEPCIVFLNGEYWGCYMLSSDFDQQYFERQYQVTQPVVTITNNQLSDYSYKSDYEKMFRFAIENDMSNSDNYEKMKQYMDIDSYIDYICVNMYLANGNYSSQKGIMWKTIGEVSDGYEDGRWRYIVPNMEYSMANEMTGGYSTYSIDSFLSPAVTTDVFFQSMLTNEEFRTLLLERMQELANSVFNEESVSRELQYISNLMRKQVAATYKRFKGEFKEDFYSSEITKIETFFERRPEYILLYTKEVVEAGGDLELISAAKEILDEYPIIEEEIKEENTENN